MLKYVPLMVLVMGCGSADDGEQASDAEGPLDFIADGRLPVHEYELRFGPDPRDPTAPYVVSRLELDAGTVDFIQVYVGDQDPQPSIITTRTIRGEDPVQELQNSVETKLTPAEIYIGLTGGARELPTELALDHLSAVEFIQRDDTNLIHSTRQPATTSEKAILPIFIPVIPGHHWIETVTSRPTFSAVSDNYVCSPFKANGPVAFPGYPSASNSCTKNRVGWIRAGANNAGIVGSTACAGGCTAAFLVQTVQMFFGPSTSGAWASLPAEVLEVGFTKISDWSNPAAKRLALTTHHAIAAGNLSVITEVFAGTSEPN